MCGVNREHEMSEEEKNIRQHVVIGIETLLTHPHWEFLKRHLIAQVEEGHMCGAGSHDIAAHYEVSGKRRNLTMNVREYINEDGEPRRETIKTYEVVEDVPQ